MAVLSTKSGTVVVGANAETPHLSVPSSKVLPKEEPPPPPPPLSSSEQITFPLSSVESAPQFPNPVQLSVEIFIPPLTLKPPENVEVEFRLVVFSVPRSRPPAIVEVPDPETSKSPLVPRLGKLILDNLATKL